MLSHSNALDAITDQVRQARATSTLLRVRGGGSKDFFGSNLQGEVLDTRGLRGIVAYEPTELVVTVRAGTPLAELEAALLEKNQCLPFEPPHFGADDQATVGGVVAAGLSGPARASAGAAKDYVLGARFINGQGEHLTFGGQVMKNVAGYDVGRLLAASWGTLGVITEVSLKVLSFAPCEATLVCDLGQAQALDLLQRWGGQPLPLNASCWVHDAGGGETDGVAGGDKLFVRLRGAVAAVQSALPRMRADVLALGGAAHVMDNAQAGPDWAAARDQRLPFFSAPPAPGACLWRLSVAQTTPVLDLPYAQFIEWHGGQRWLWAPASAATQLHSLAQRAGGHATLFRRPKGALANTEAGAPVFAAQDTTQSRIQSALQTQFDPDGVFNTRRLHAAV
jgi:glycolate oxidase FAD binding subunit